MTALPPCIVLGVETQIGLGIVRELGRAGIRVVGIAHDPRAIGLASRYLWRSVIVPEPRSDALLATIRALGDELGDCCLMAVSETNLQWLAAHHGTLGRVRAAVPAADKLALVLDKQRTLQAAQEVGIPVPQSVEPRTLQEAQALAAHFKFPAVLKWKDPNAVAPLLRAHGLSLMKAEYVYTPRQWLDVAARYAPLDEWPMVQSYCPGRGLGQFFFMHEGKAVRRFQHLRIAEWPPEGGFSSVCDALPLEQCVDLQERSIALLQHIGWDGLAMVEYRYEPATQEAALMEINGRYWGSFPLAVHCNAGFALLTYQACLGLPLAALPPPRQDIRCRMVATELKRLVRICLQPERIADKSFPIRKMAEITRFVCDFLRPKVRYYVWSWRDPKPSLRDLTNLLRRSA